MKLSFYLFNDKVKDFNDLIKSGKITENENYYELTPKEKTYDFEFKVYIQKNKEKPPKWLKFLEQDLIIEDKDNIRNTINSFIILVKTIIKQKTYFMALTAGFGFTAINRDNIEPNFGLKVALNCVDQNSLKTFDVRNIDLKTRQKRILINKGSNISEFELNFDQDLINIVAGKPADKSVGSKIYGSDSLGLNADISFKDIGQKCVELVKLYLSDEYKKNYGFIDHIKVVKNTRLINELNELLVTSMNQLDSSRISLAYPDMIEYERCTSYKISFNGKVYECNEITIEALYELLNEVELADFNDIKKNIKIVGFYDDGTPATAPVSLFDFIVFEAEKDDKLYILSLKNWHNVEDNYVKSINGEIKKIPLMTNISFLPSMKPTEKEGEYNSRLDNNYFILFDKDNFQLPNSYSKVEVCDLFSKDKHFVCVKKDTRSATLSHLFAQGSVSMTMFKDYQAYQEFLFDKINNKFPELCLKANDIKYEEYTLVYAISSNREGDIREIIPFFSKVNLVQHYKQIKRLGIDVNVYKINIA